MCFGVRDALAAAEALPDPSGVTIYGELVHNPLVGERLAERGFRQLDELERDVPRTEAVLVTAHGVSDREAARLREHGLRIVDTTCPLVRAAHAAARELDREGRLVVVVGRAGHVEIRGLVGDLRRSVVVAGPEEVERWPDPRIGVLAQTTTPAAQLHAVVRAIRRANPDADVRVADTVCRPTRDRQESLAELLPHVSALVVVGGRGSRNTLELVRAAEAAGVRAIHVESAAELDPAAFAGIETVGLTAGTSTLPETVEEVHERLRGMAPP